jgi:hypothetical protein
MAGDEEVAMETAPLLQDSPPARPPNPRAKSSFLPQTHNPTTITLLLAFLAFILGFGSYLNAVPTTRIFEDIICHHYYDRQEAQHRIGLTDKIDEGLCKVDEIQEELALIKGISVVAAALPGMLLAGSLRNYQFADPLIRSFPFHTIWPACR